VIIFKGGDKICCYVKYFPSFCIGATEPTSALRLPSIFYPVVGSLDRTADLQVMALACESASLNLQRTATDAKSAQGCSQWRTLAGASEAPQGWGGW